MKVLHLFILSLLFISSGSAVNAQADFYDISHIPEIRIYFDQENWDEILDSLYIEGELSRLGADVNIDGTLYQNAGIRYKGFSSYSSTRMKNPFNIDLDYGTEDQNHQGYKKIKLSNVIQDPSFIRETLSYHIARKYMPASQANYANVYVNDTLIGLYTNVEAVNNDFLQKHFNYSENTFFKCNPEHLELNGENANLSNSPGTDLENYLPLYKLKSDDLEGWNELYEFIDVLNETPENVETLLNVDQTLWMHAFNYALINFDSYVGYAQNYYLYKDLGGKFNPILWDLNMSFASYRLTDASDNWDGFTIEEAKTIDPLQHINSFSVQPRPLIRNLLSDETYQRMYLAHLRTIVEENFTNQDYYAQGAYMQSVINQSVAADTNKFYSYQDFQDNITTTVSDLVDYPGITELIDARASYLSTYPGIQGAPDITNVINYPSTIDMGDEVWINATVNGTPLNVLLAYRLSEKESFTVIPMVDDGSQQDGAAGDGMFGARIPTTSANVHYYVYAENDTVGRFSPERAAFEFYEMNPRITTNGLVINEIMTNNTMTIADQDDEYDSWIEIANSSTYDIQFDSLYLSNDSLDLLKWKIPSSTVISSGYLTVWLDGDSLQEGLHTNFVLDPEGGSIWFSNPDGTVIDSLVYSPQEEIASYGRYPNATGPFVDMLPTYSAKNDRVEVAALTDEVFVYPNPTSIEVNVRVNTEDDCDIALYTLDGRKIRSTQTVSGGGTVTIATADLSNGIYLLHATYKNESCTKKILITH